MQNFATVTSVVPGIIAGAEIENNGSLDPDHAPF